MKSIACFLSGILFLLLMGYGAQSCKSEENTSTTTVEAPADQAPDFKKILPGKYRITKVWFEVKQPLNADQQAMLDTANDNLAASGEFLAMMQKAVLQLQEGGRFRVIIEDEEAAETEQGSWEVVSGNLLKTTDDKTGKIEHDTLRMNGNALTVVGSVDMNEFDPGTAQEISTALGVSAVFLGVIMEKE